jgi:pyruvate dehydrogenase E1 component alpha subunit
VPGDDLYRTVRLIRRFEERALELVKAGEIGSGIHPCIGQEGVAAGVCAALGPGDKILSSHRGHGHLLAKGTDPRRLMAEMAGRATGIDGGRGGSFHPSDPDVGVVGATGTVGHSAAIAAGVAWSLAKSGSDRVVACFFGDGAVSQGALLEGLNLASLWRLPVVYVCENNRYATTLPVDSAVAGTITGRGEAFGIPSVTIDGQDPETVRAATAEAVARARGGHGPSLIECLTYRFHGHHTFENGVRLTYRDPAEVAAWKERDPLDLAAARVSAEDRRKLDAEIEDLLDEVVAFTLASPKPEPVDGLAWVYADDTPIRAGVADA